MATALIGLDWGTTSFRAYRLDHAGQILERRRAALGILQVPERDFEAALEGEIRSWLEPERPVPVIASGMITSRQGWVEVPYLSCPASAEDLARTLLAYRTHAGRTIHFVPGLSIVGEDGVPDVMRGEETQIIGARQGAPDPALFVLPGTHSKWALVEEGRITWFATFMTGEVFGVLKWHSILGRLMSGETHDEDAFTRGLAYAGEGGSGLLKRLFSARTLGLFEILPGSAIASYLSGLLIGTEIAEALSWSPRLSSHDITVIGESSLAARYLQALEARGLRARAAPDDVAARGLFEIARAAGLLP